MTRKEAIDYASIIKAFIEGKEIQVQCPDGRWADIKVLHTDQSLNYRIKPSFTYQPFKNSDECWQELSKHSPFGWITDRNDKDCKSLITSLDNEGIMIADYEEDASFLSYESAFKQFKFVDNVPFGKMES